MMLSKISRTFVACNVYVSAGGNPNHRDVLLKLLGETQELCRLANHREKSNRENNSAPAPSRRVAVVHSFRDGPYDRSSFHLAGSPDLVAAVGSSLAVRAVQALLRYETSGVGNVVGEGNGRDPRRVEQGEREWNGKRHPTVGIVDHVSVLPLCEKKRTNKTGDYDSEDGHGNTVDPDEKTEFANATGSVAKSIGERLTLSGADVLYYGHAHPSGKELAAVRRDSTRFFKDGGDSENNHGATPTHQKETSKPAANAAVGQATVGAPHGFVENYNIRLKPGVSRRMARTLTESVRERSGRGLPFVEALTLAYGRDQYEVACNLLDPSVTSARDVEERMKIWEQQQQEEDASGGLVDTAYRVGTTVEMCLAALREVSTEEGEIAHNKRVFNRLEEYFLVP